MCEVLIKQDGGQQASAVLSDLTHRCWQHPELGAIARRAVELQDELTFDRDGFLDEMDVLERELDVEFLIGVVHDIWDATTEAATLTMSWSGPVWRAPMRTLPPKIPMGQPIRIPKH
ncbi:hypothetical protein [Mycobacterium sp. pW045]|uniref:hypothetical protein n=1 Tax=Mycobacterium sp. pW045 TaxID=3238984 RepID=UPI00351B6FF4